jgi:hypothetical protein
MRDVERGGVVVKSVVRGVLALVLTALATWLAKSIADAIFGPDEATA